MHEIQLFCRWLAICLALWLYRQQTLHTSVFLILSVKTLRLLAGQPLQALQDALLPSRAAS